MRGHNQEANGANGPNAHSKSVSPVKEIVYRRAGFRANAIMPSEDISSSTDMRRFFFQRTRQHSALQEFYREQAQNEVSRPDLDAKENHQNKQPQHQPQKIIQKQSPTQPPPSLKVRRGQTELSLNFSKTPTSSISSTKDGPIFTRPKLGTKVNSIDSLNKDSTANSTCSSTFTTNNKRPETMHPNQGSPASTRREFPNVSTSTPLVPSHMATSHGYTLAPAPGQILVDPTTGQHYVLPAQVAQPQLAYYPVFYNPAQPPPPLYPQGAYLVTSLPNAPPIATQARPILLHSNAGYHTAPVQSAPVSTFAGYQTETPALSTAVPSVCGDAQNELPNYFQRAQGARNSMESAGSSSASYPHNKHSDDSMSPSPGMVPQNNASTSFAQMPLYNHDTQARFSTTSSSTSGFASGESTVEPSSTHSKKLPPRTPLYGSQPAWWGEDSAKSGLSDQDRTPTKYQQKFSPPMVDRSTPPEGPNDSPKSEPPTTITPPKQQVFKSIRMDIDLSRPMTPPEKTVKVSNVQRAPPTAFTVTFDSDNDSKKAKPSTLQDAARQKRFLRRNAPNTAPGGNRNSAPAGEAQASGDESNQDPKHYLFTKMIQGYRKSSPIAENPNVLIVSQEKEIDTVSEAGTYVIDNKSRANQMTSSQVLDSDEESSSTATTVSDTGTTPCSSTAPEVKPTLPISARSNESSEKLAMDETAKPKRLMTALKTMREQQYQQVASKPPPKPVLERPSRRSEQPSTSNAPATRICGRPVTAATPNTNNFRRSDGGRFSMRSPNASNFGRTPVQSSSTGKPPLKHMAKPAPQKDTPEMTAWLRRKEYDPRKSAMEARKMQQLKSSLLNITSAIDPNQLDPDPKSDNYTSNRSISFHHGGGGFMNRPLADRMRDDRSNRSHDDLSRIGEDIDEFNDVPQHLTKAVDELTEKCNKSIQLLKICNQNTLSESVENLLEKVVKPATNPDSNDDDISVRLMRLNSAFDAISKYFEEQSIGGNLSPQIKLRTAPEPFTSLTSETKKINQGSRPSSRASGQSDTY